ncbi:Aldose 1-epimerase [Yarrowia sp. B02]|nr:Aldose 1-epimerase [Yarrowia sp. B02]
MTTFSSIGATVQAFENCTLGFQNEKYYLHKENPYFGATIGPVANRLYQSEGIVLHGGEESWTWKEWKRSEEGHVTKFELNDGDIDAHVTYTVTKPNSNTTQLEIEYLAKSKEGKSVPVSMTNHSYFCLGQDGENVTVDDHELWLCNDRVIEHKGGLQSEAPTGELVACKPLDEAVKKSEQPQDSQGFHISLNGVPLDHTFAVDNQRLSEPKLDTREDPLVTVAVMSRDKTRLTVKTTEPCFQVYTGDYNNASLLPGESRAFGARSGVAIECSRPTNAWNVPKWKNWADLGNGEYGAKIVYVLERM